MLFNCFKCGKSISSKQDVCVYCKVDVSHFVMEFNREHQKGILRQNYSGTFFALLLKTKVK